MKLVIISPEGRLLEESGGKHVPARLREDAPSEPLWKVAQREADRASTNSRPKDGK